MNRVGMTFGVEENMEKKLGGVRKITALVVLGASFVATAYVAWSEMNFTCGGAYWDHHIQLGVITAWIATAFYGVARERVWGRWAGLAAGIFAVWRVSSNLFAGIIPDWEHLFMGLSGMLLTCCLLGRTMYARYEGRVFGELPASRWDRFRLLVVRWSAVVAITMFPFIIFSVIVGSPSCGGLLPDSLYRPILAGLGGAVLFGVVLIARQKTAGVLLIAIAGSMASWLFGSVMSYTGELNTFEAACRAGHSLIYLLPALILAAPMFRLLTRRDR